jgi:DNA-binding winged helix-turn-helix (wHTH) protein
MRRSISPKRSPIDVPKFLEAPRPARWVANKKAAVVIAVRSGLLSASEACDRYLLSVDELTRWEAAFESEGRVGLHLKRRAGMAERQRTGVNPHYSSVSGVPAKLRRSITSRAHAPRVNSLTPKEHAILQSLSRKKGAVVEKGKLLDDLYGGSNVPDVKIIDVFICKLRQKLARELGGDNCIETVWGRGYRLCSLIGSSSESVFLGEIETVIK